MSKKQKIPVKKFVFVLITTFIAILAAKGVISYIAAASGSVTADEAVEFMEKLGWEIDTKEISSEEIHIPSDFNEVYERYNAIQLKQGYDLTKYKGEKVLKYTLRITNFDDYANIEAHLLTWGGRIIGGDICNTELNGFMTGLEGFEKNGE